MDVVRRTADFAENQTKFFITDINSKDNGARLKAIKRYKEYITTYRPEMYEDDVDFLFTGSNEQNGIHTAGLLQGCGQLSSKHDGHLKRIAGNLMSFVQWLITLECEGDVENIFFERFIRLPASELVQMALDKHISLDNTSALSGAGKRGGNTAVACEVLSTLMQYHLTEDGDPDPLDVDYMLNNDSESKRQFMKWLGSSADDQTINAVVNRPARVVRPQVEVAAECWQDVQQRFVPLQADEAGYGGEEELDYNEFDHIIPDPLGLSSIDLRSVLVTSHSQVPSRDKRASDSTTKKKKRMTTTSSQKMSIMKKIISKKSRGSSGKDKDKSKKGEENFIDSIVEEVETETETETEGNEVELEDEFAISVIPSQKHFSSATFLSYVHGYVSLPNLILGMKNLELRLDQQSSRREDLVRQNFGLFICCVDGLSWLKDFQGLNPKPKDVIKPLKTVKPSVKQSGSKHPPRRVSFFGKDEDEDEEGARKVSSAHGKTNKGGLPEASVYLSKAKEEAQNTLAPILSRMKRSRQLKNADQILRRLASFMEYPHAMRQLMNKGDYESVINIYHRVESLPATSNLRILQRITTKASAIMDEMKQKLIMSLMQSQPVLPIVVRHMKLLNEMESEEVCRGILQRCFDKQAQAFEDSVRAIASKLNDSLAVAFMKGQEFNLNNKGNDKQLTPQDQRSAYAKGAQSNGTGSSSNPNRRKNNAMMKFATAQRSLMDNLGAESFSYDSYDDDEGLHIDEFGIPHSTYHSPSKLEESYLESDKDSDRLSVGSMESGCSSAIEKQNDLRRILGDEFDKSFVDDDPDVDYTELLCSKVRVRDVTKMVDAIDQWVPSLHKVIQMLRSYSTSTQQPTMTPSQKRLTSFNSNLARGNLKGVSVAYGRNQAVAGETKRMGEVLTISADFLQAVILGINSASSSQSALQKNKHKDGENKNVFVESISKAFHHMFQGAMIEPHLSESVVEVSEIFEVIESILSDRDREGATPHPAHDDSAAIEMNFFGSSSYREAVFHLKSVAHDGENAVATRVMEQLIAQSLMLTSSVHKGSAATKQKVRDIDDIIRVFENLAIKHLQSLVAVVRYPAWIAKLVWESVQKVLDRFISSLALMAAAVESLNEKVYSEQSYSRQRSSFDSGSAEEKAPVVYSDKVSAARLHLENLEASLLNTQHIQLAKNKSLDFVKACVRLRTNTVAKIWEETNSIFPLPVNNVAGPVTTMLFRQGSSIAGAEGVPERRHSGAAEQRRPSLAGAAHSNIEERISLSTGSILVLEENAVDKYLEFILLNFRTNAHASYSVIVKNEMTSDESSKLNHRGLPTHMSRVLLDLGHIQSSLSSILTGMTVAASTEWKNKTSYESYLFHLICVSVLTVFTDLVDSLARNSFSLHSTGRKYQSRRLSNSSLASDPRSRAATSLSLDEEEEELRYYSQCKYPLSCGQALEELEFFKMALLPVLLTATDIPTNMWIHDEGSSTREAGKKRYLSRDELMQEGMLFVEAIRNKSSVCRTKRIA